MPDEPESSPGDADEVAVSTEELTTRFGCGGVLGIFIALFLIVGFSLSSPVSCIIIVLLAISVFGFLAARYGDQFWHRFVEFLRWW